MKKYRIQKDTYMTWSFGGILYTNFSLLSHAICQTTKDACDFIFKPGFLEVAPGPELLIVQSVLGQRLCLNPLCQWGFHPVLRDLCATWGMTSKRPQLLLWLLLSRCLVHAHNLPDPQSWLPFQEGYSLLSLWPFLKLPAVLLSLVTTSIMELQNTLNRPPSRSRLFQQHP